MGDLKNSNIRNMGIIAHIDAGKTTLSERILFYCDKIHRMGEVHDGAATMDFMPEEQERGITIAAACTSCRWNDCQINLVDTPGHMDFTMEVERCLRVLDSAVVVVCAVGGVEPQTETVWKQANNFSLPRLIFINKMDRQGASFEHVLEEINNKLGIKPLPLNIPAGEGENFSGIIDLIQQKKLLFDDKDHGKSITKLNLEGEEKKEAEKWRNYLEEKVAEEDDEFLNSWLEGKTDALQLENALSRICKKQKIIPVFCGSALRNIGVQPLLDGIDKYLPSPDEKDLNTLFINTNSGKSDKKRNGLLGFVFKIDMSGGRKACYLRLYNGSLKENDSVINLRTGKTQRIGKIYYINADRREQTNIATNGDIILTTGLKDARAGDTLSDGSYNCSIEPAQELPQVISYSLEPANSEEAKILDEALGRYVQEDPALSWQIDEESGLRMVSGMGELHIEVMLERLVREYKISPRTGRPQVAMRETILNEATKKAVFDKEFGKEHQLGEVEVKVEVLPRNSANEIVFNVPEEKEESEKTRLLWQQAIKDGINSVLQSGPLAGWPVVDVRVGVQMLNRNNYTLPGLEMAASLATRQALLAASPILLEPIMRLEINVPEEFLGATLQLLQQNGGKVEEIDAKEGGKNIIATAPMKKLFGFATRLRSSTQGRAGFSIAFRNHDLP